MIKISEYTVCCTHHACLSGWAVLMGLLNCHNWLESQPVIVWAVTVLFNFLFEFPLVNLVRLCVGRKFLLCFKQALPTHSPAKLHIEGLSMMMMMTHYTSWFSGWDGLHYRFWISTTIHAQYRVSYLTYMYGIWKEAANRHSTIGEAYSRGHQDLTYTSLFVSKHSHTFAFTPTYLSTQSQFVTNNK